MEVSQELDLNLHHLWNGIQDLQCHSYSDDIDKKLNDLLNYISEKLFNDIPSDYDIIDDKCILIRKIEK